MLIKIGNIEAEIADLDEEVEELKRRITRTLKDQKLEREKAKEIHEDEINHTIVGN